jgi:hypothetical protein
MTQHTEEQSVPETTTVERVEEQPAPCRTLQIEALESRLAPTTVPPDPIPGI